MAAATHDPRNTQPVLRRGRARVVIADDAASLRELLRLLLEEDGGYDVVGAAADGEALLDVVRELRPDLVLLDLTMPVLDGLGALCALRSLIPDGRIVVFSGCDESAVRRRAMAAGADDYIEKTVGVSELIARLPRQH